jgi:hypothetical protein
VLYLNGAGDFSCGGTFGDNGLSGKKLVVDGYGPSVPIGGGALCGKDPHKVDRLGALAARQLAVRLVRDAGAGSARVMLGWLPGAQGPDTVYAVVDGDHWPEARIRAAVTVPDPSRSRPRSGGSSSAQSAGSTSCAAATSGTGGRGRGELVRGLLPRVNHTPIPNA